jgi:hypothetical protein
MIFRRAGTAPPVTPVRRQGYTRWTTSSFGNARLFDEEYCPCFSLVPIARDKNANGG